MGWFGGSSDDASGSSSMNAKDFSSSDEAFHPSSSGDMGSLGGAAGGAGEMQQFSMALRQQIVVQQVISDLSDRAFVKCISKPSDGLSGKEAACIHATVNKCGASSIYPIDLVNRHICRVAHSNQSVYSVPDYLATSIPMLHKPSFSSSQQSCRLPSTNSSIILKPQAMEGTRMGTQEVRVRDPVCYTCFSHVAIIIQPIVSSPIIRSSWSDDWLNGYTIQRSSYPHEFTSHLGALLHLSGGNFSNLAPQCGILGVKCL